jgi:NAD kinase
VATLEFDKIVLVTRRTRLEELIERFNTRGQAKFYITHAGGDFDDYEREHDAYHRALDRLKRDLDFGLPRQVLDRTLVPTYTFGPRELVVTLGQDGLVANVAKYALDLPIVGVNPDPARFDGVLLPFLPEDAQAAVRGVLAGTAAARAVTLAEIRLDDGQRLLAFNDLFIGARSHTSARYRISAHGAVEAQSSSGVLISTGAGSTGWMSSVFNMAAGVSAFAAAAVSVTESDRGPARPAAPAAAAGRSLAWDDPRLIFAVREPFVSRHSAATIIAGFLDAGEEIAFESLMPSGGVIFSDGIESDFLQFNAGAIGRARTARQHARLIVR